MKLFLHVSSESQTPSLSFSMNTGRMPTPVCSLSIFNRDITMLDNPRLSGRQVRQAGPPPTLQAALGSPQGIQRMVALRRIGSTSSVRWVQWSAARIRLAVALRIRRTASVRTALQEEGKEAGREARTGQREGEEARRAAARILRAPPE
jgi:hypothetical protein